jgi:2-polyprenyl-3-methyl-5-hydroxy-6-metoxy-1,4-benzoquinol methylase
MKKDNIKNIAKKIYYSRISNRIRKHVGPWRTKRDYRVFIPSQLLDNSKDMRSTLTYELCDFFKISENSLLKRMNSKNAIKENWFEIQRLDKEQIENFYENESFIFNDLLEAVMDGMGFLGVRKVVGALELSMSLKDRLGNEYLDYGCGLGCCPILFNKYGFNVSISDISNLLLSFAKCRLKNRNITCESFDLKSDALPAKRFSFITCYDVLEHAYNPMEIIVKIREALRIGGVLFLYFAYGINKDNPTHVIADNSCIKRISGLGFEELVRERDKIMRDRNHFFIFEKI